MDSCLVDNGSNYNWLNVKQPMVRLFSETIVGHMTIHQMTMGQMTFGQLKVGKMKICQIRIFEISNFEIQRFLWPKFLMPIFKMISLEITICFSLSLTIVNSFK